MTQPIASASERLHNWKIVIRLLQPLRLGRLGHRIALVFGMALLVLSVLGASVPSALASPPFGAAVEAADPGEPALLTWAFERGAVDFEDSMDEFRKSAADKAAWPFDDGLAQSGFGSRAHETVMAGRLERPPRA